MKALSKKTAAASHSTHQVRIIGGRWKRTPLSVVTVEGLRPTPDRVRETVFNWFSHLLDGHWQSLRGIDLFAGSGALGFEAASRGVAHVMMIESNVTAFRQLQLIKEKLGADQTEVIRGDALAIAEKLVVSKQKFDLIFLDPPFGKSILQKILPICADLITDRGLVYVEAEHALLAVNLIATEPDSGQDWLAGWDVIRADKAGSVFFHILQRNIAVREVLEIQA
jgi:16S rRNA (guanine966-N2)-methyltransferase